MEGALLVWPHEVEPWFHSWSIDAHPNITPPYAATPTVEGYKTIVDTQTVFVHPSSALFNRQPDW